MTGFQTMTVEQIIARCTRMPVCPVLFSRLTAALQNPTQNICDLAEIISMDPVLTAKVLRAANSSVYGMTRTVRSVDDAIIRLGFEDVFSIAAAARAKELFAATDQWEGFGEQCWAHAVVSAVIARTLARKVVPGRVEDSYYTAALLHDFGKLLFGQIDISYMVLCDYGAIYGDDLVNLERERYGASHPQLGAEMMRRWGLPQLIISAVELHHQPLVEDNSANSHSWIVMAADHLAHVRAETNDDSQTELPEIIAERLGISPGELGEVLAESNQQIDVLAGV